MCYNEKSKTRAAALGPDVAECMRCSGRNDGSVGFAAPVSSSASVAVEASSADETPATVGTITLGGDSITVSGNGATVNGTTVTITQPGNYDISGELSDGQISWMRARRTMFI